VSVYPDEEKKEEVRKLFENALQLDVRAKAIECSYLYCVDSPEVQNVRFSRGFFDNRDLKQLRSDIERLQLATAMKKAKKTILVNNKEIEEIDERDNHCSTPS